MTSVKIMLRRREKNYEHIVSPAIAMNFALGGGGRKNLLEN